MVLLVLLFFMPLFLIGWVLTPREEREHRVLESEREQQIARTWGVVFGRESQVMRRDASLGDDCHWRA